MFERSKMVLEGGVSCLGEAHYIVNSYYRKEVGNMGKLFCCGIYNFLHNIDILPGN